MNYRYRPNYLQGYPPSMEKYASGAQAGPQTIVIRQVIGENQTQKVVDMAVPIPPQHPAIEQIIDVLVRRLRITRVEAIPNKVIVCGDFEVKALYVACLPDQPVHALEVRKVRFTTEVPIRGAYWGMDAEARAAVEFVDYDCDPRTRAYWHKQNQYGYNQYGGPVYPPAMPGAGESAWGHGPQMNCSKFNVTVVLRVIAKVMADREVTIYPEAFPGLPPVPQG